ncbi:uncharacterized protein LOC125657839 isoform X2 [Ostrea edulis]|uniref:uncharacterized protein LOC125657839 isoform X2 n=1 Tax=Ostrea edulis TaxID=37623 RepID=UPI00209613DA|nr:uncharacterized protein LOC125657839 isoform X2 [Ostrea edulis]
MVTESRTLLHGERSCLKKKNATQIGMVLINVTKKVWVRRRRCNGCDIVFYCFVAVYVMFVFVFVVQYENLTQPISGDLGRSFPVQREMDRKFLTPTKLDKLSIFARIRQRPNSIQDEMILHHLQIPAPLQRKTTESIYISGF